MIQATRQISKQSPMLVQDGKVSKPKRMNMKQRKNKKAINALIKQLRILQNLNRSHEVQTLENHIFHN